MAGIYYFSSNHRSILFSLTYIYDTLYKMKHFTLLCLCICQMYAYMYKITPSGFPSHKRNARISGDPLIFCKVIRLLLVAYICIYVHVSVLYGATAHLYTVSKLLFRPDIPCRYNHHTTRCMCTLLLLYMLFLLFSFFLTQGYKTCHSLLFYI